MLASSDATDLHTDHDVGSTLTGTSNQVEESA